MKQLLICVLILIISLVPIIYVYFIYTPSKVECDNKIEILKKNINEINTKKTQHTQVINQILSTNMHFEDYKTKILDKKTIEFISQPVYIANGIRGFKITLPMNYIDSGNYVDILTLKSLESTIYDIKLYSKTEEFSVPFGVPFFLTSIYLSVGNTENTILNNAINRYFYQIILLISNNNIQVYIDQRSNNPIEILNNSKIVNINTLSNLHLHNILIFDNKNIPSIKIITGNCLLNLQELQQRDC